MNDDSIMKYDSVLPADFDGVFRFTNPSDEGFIGRWGSRDYVFQAQTTSPMIMPEHSPLEIQQIRKKFARDLAEREFFKSDKYSTFYRQEKNPDGSPRLNSIHQAGTYSLDDLAPYIQRCLEPLPISKAIVQEAARVRLEDTLTRNESGDLNTEAIDKRTSLRKKALEA